MNTRPISRRLARYTVALVLLTAVAAGDAAAAKTTLALRVNDAEGAPGDLVAVVVRTYSPRPIRQGQIAVRARRKRKKIANEREASASAGAGPFVALESYRVFSSNNDVQATASFQNGSGKSLMTLVFSSASGTINKSDGPLAVLYLRLSDKVKPGQEFEIFVDGSLTSVLNAQGKRIKLRPRPGRLRVRRPRGRPELDVDGDSVKPGEIAEITVKTSEPIPMSRGSLALRYDPDVFTGSPTVKMDNRHGKRRFDVDTSQAGLLVVTFRSGDGSWNLVPGEVLSVAMPTSPTAPAGQQTTVNVDRDLTTLYDDAGEPIEYQFRKGTVRIEQSDDPGSVEFKGQVSAVDTGAGAMSLSDGEQVNVDAATYWDPQGDFTSLEAVMAALAGGQKVKIEGEGARQQDGNILATQVRVRADKDTGDDDGGDGGGGAIEVEFEGRIASIDTASSSITIEDGTVVRVDPITEWRDDGDFTDLDSVAAAFQAGDTVKIDGDGFEQDDGSVLATKIRARRKD